MVDAYREYNSEFERRAALHGKSVRRVALACILLGVLLMLVLEVDGLETIIAAEITPTKSPLVYIAPMDMTLEDIEVRDGQTVNRGAVVLRGVNKALDNDIARVQGLIVLKKQQLEKRNDLLSRLKERVSLEQKNWEGRERLLSDASAEVLKSQKEYAEALTLLSEMDSQSTELRKVWADAYEKGVISRAQMQERRLDFLRSGFQKHLTRSDGHRLKAEAHVRRIRDNLTLSYDIDLLSLKDQLLNTESLLLAEENEIVALERELGALMTSRDELVLTAPYDATVSMMIRQPNSSLILRGEKIARLHLKDTRYICRCFVSEKSINRVEIGAKVHLRIDAYSYLKFGPITGVVEYVKPPVDGRAELIVELDYDPKFELKDGYSADGEVVVETVKLYQFIYKKLFS